MAAVLTLADRPCIRTVSCRVASSGAAQRNEAPRAGGQPARTALFAGVAGWPGRM